jgi:hypothetical protein
VDELESVRHLYGEPELDPSVKVRVRERVTAKSKSRPWWKMTAAGLMAAAAVAAVTVPGLVQKAEAPAPVVALSGRSILIAAAGTAEAGPETGHYWRVKKLYRQEFPVRVGRGENRYSLVHSWLDEEWVTRDGRLWSASRSLGARPATAADRAAWRRDGSPTTWRVQQDMLLSASPDKGRVSRDTGKVAFSMAGHEITFKQLRGLPTEPAALTGWVTKAVRETTDPIDGVIADALSGLLWSKPTPPDVRGAAYRALADLPNVRYLGTAKDERGRSGAAFSFLLYPDAGLRRTLIIDTGDAQVLASTLTGPAAGKADEIEVLLDAGWTDDKPAIPTLP